LKLARGCVEDQPPQVGDPIALEIREVLRLAEAGTAALRIVGVVSD